MKTNCDKYPFDYNKHIIIKTIITPAFRQYTEFEDMFQGISTCVCDKCFVTGFEGVSMPFKFEDLSQDEIRCTLNRMGLKKLDIADVDIMPQIMEHEGENLCLTCKEEVENEAMADLYEELEEIDVNDEN